MDAIKYYWRWIKTAFTHSFEAIDLWTGIIGAFFGVIDHFLPQAQINANWAWQIPIWVLGTIIFIRLLLAPFWMSREDATIFANLKQAADFNECRITIKNEIGEALATGSKLISECKTTSDPKDIEERMNEWLTKIHVFVMNVLGEGEAQLIINGSGLTVYSACNVPNSELKAAMDFKLQRLAQLLQRIDTIPLRQNSHIANAP